MIGDVVFGDEGQADASAALDQALVARSGQVAVNAQVGIVLELELLLLLACD